MGIFQYRKALGRKYKKHLWNNLHQKRKCNPHEKIENLHFFSEHIRKRNTNTNYIVTEILIVDNCKHPFCMNSWCFKIYGTRLYGGDIPM